MRSFCELWKIGIWYDEIHKIKSKSFLVWAQNYKVFRNSNFVVNVFQVERFSIDKFYDFVLVKWECLMPWKCLRFSKICEKLKELADCALNNIFRNDISRMLFETSGKMGGKQLHTKYTIFFGKTVVWGNAPIQLNALKHNCQKFSVFGKRLSEWR